MRDDGVYLDGRSYKNIPRLFLGSATSPFALEPEQLEKRNVLNKVFILVGIAPLKSYKVAQYLHTKVPGVSLPGKILMRMENAGESASEEGVQIALEVIDSVKRKQGINGIHIMTLSWESIVQRIVTESGLLSPRTAGADV